jgi:hypothetical protein
MVRVFNHLQNQQKSNFEIISKRLPVLAVSGKVIAVGGKRFTSSILPSAKTLNPGDRSATIR